MTRSRFPIVACIVFSCFAGSLAAAPQAGDPSIENTLAVQRTVVQARDHLFQGESKKAVDLLEANIGRVNGDRKYLTLLRDAYRSYIKDLSLANQQSTAEVYQKRLKILDDYEGGPQVIGATATPAVVQHAPLVSPAVSTPPAHGDPFAAANELKIAPAAAQILQPQAEALARNLLAKAYEEFLQKRYASAKHLYEQANHLDTRVMGDEGRARWAYCQLIIVVEQINRFPAQQCDWAQLEFDIKNAAVVAPHLGPTAKEILASMAKRRDAAPRTALGAMPHYPVKHSPRRADGWQLAETTNFRVLHNQSAEYAAKVAEVAEVTRAQMSHKWFGREGDDWSPKCDIYLYANASEYSKRTDQSGASPGHSKIDLNAKAGRVAIREIHLRCDNPALLEAILPHETTHVVLAGQFGSHHVPRWADEGIAVLTEPSEKVQQHRGNLAKSLTKQELIPLQNLMKMDNYPAPAQISTFYAQSVALVEFLSQLKGPVVMTQFVRDGLHEGYDSALRKHYGYQSITELQQHFTQHILAETNR